MNPPLTEALFSMAMVLFGAPAEVTLIDSPLPACEARDQTARTWRKTRSQVFSHEEAHWCIVALLNGGVWHAEQWRREDTPRAGWRSTAQAKRRSHGWAVKIALSSLPSTSATSRSHRLAPGVEIQALRHPGMTVAQAHRQALSSLLPRADSSAVPSQFAHASPDYLVHRVVRGTSVVTLVTMHADALGTVQVQLTESQP